MDGNRTDQGPRIRPLNSFDGRGTKSAHVALSQELRAEPDSIDTKYGTEAETHVDQTPDTELEVVVQSLGDLPDAIRVGIVATMKESQNHEPHRFLSTCITRGTARIA